MIDSQFTGLYPISKTLRFELKPVGKTLENIEKNGLISQDDKRAESYKAVKKIIDKYHKDFIEKSLQNCTLKFNSTQKLDSLEEFYCLYNSPINDEMRKKNLSKVQENLRKEIVKSFTENEDYKTLFAKELIREKLPAFVEELAERNMIAEFNDFTTYFTGFHENRKNMYVADEKSTAISYRMINENLPKFIDNMDVYINNKLNEILQPQILKLYKEMGAYLNVTSIDEIFSLDYFSEVLTQTQIDVYNAIIGGRTENDIKIQGLNEYINLYNQQQKDKSKRLPKLKALYKQILSDREAISWLPDEFVSDNQMLENIEKCYQDIHNQLFENEHSLKQLLLNLREYDLNHIYLKNDLQLTDISQKLFKRWDVIQKAFESSLIINNPKGKKDTNEQYEEKISKLYKGIDSCSIGELNEALKSQNISVGVETYFANLGAENSDELQIENVFAQIENAYTDVKDLLNQPYPENKNLAQDKKNVEKLKTLLDAIKSLQFFVKPLLGNGTESEKDARFYGEFTPLYEVLDCITPLYNKVRNRMTRKPYSEEKIKLNFANSTLLDGWDLNKEPDNTGVILRKDGMYYLAIMDKKNNKVFKDCKFSSGECYEKMEYKLLPGANKMLPKVFFSKSRIAEFNPSETLLKNYEKGTHKKGPDFSIDDCHTLINFFKSSINKHEDWKNFDFEFSDTKTYEDLSGFYREVEQQGYKVSFRNVAISYVNQLVDDGKIYLFQIYNKDFSQFSKGTPNMHTLYWKTLFDEKNLADVVYKLNGQAEVFFRKKSITIEKPTHPANQPIKNKNVENSKKESLFTYDLIKNKRYTVDKFQFHVPITMNFKAPGMNNINPLVNEYLKTNKTPYIIGIDRGERHLLYLSLIDSNGKIVEQFTMNDIVNEYNGNTYKTNYHDLLDAKEKNRDEARKSWQTIENIKELKEGYLSQVIHKITQLMVKYNAIVVLEDLNMGFMRGRQKVEKQVYQKFEKMLIDKLNYLVDKKALATDNGGVLKAYQLTNKFESFKKLGKQSGFLFYIPAWNTSKMDPVTGFVNLFDTRYENIEKTKLFFSKFDSIKYNASKNWFEFSFDYDKFTTKAEGTRTQWTICTFGERIETKRDAAQNNQFVSEEFNLTEKFKDFFAQYSIDPKGNLKESIANQTDKRFFEGLLHLLHLTLQMRNSKTGTEIDYMISPVADARGNFYDSRKKIVGLPDNADANGAYNIARKGLWIIDQIKQSDDLTKLKLAISNKEWLQYVQQFNK